MSAPSGWGLMLSLVASVSAALAALMFLASMIASSGFAARPPQGADAMGLVVYLVLSVLAALLLLLATACLLAGGRLDGIGLRPAWLSLPFTALLGAAAVGALLIWAEGPAARGWVAMLGTGAGGIAPILACMLAAVAAWSEPTSLRGASWLPGVQAMLLIGATGALALLGGALLTATRH